VIKTRPILRYFVAALCVAAVAHAQGKRRNPTSKLYVADIVGEAEIDNGVEIQDLTKRSVFNAEGTVIDTKANSNVTIVLSNGTGIYIDVDTRVAIKTFAQGAFRPNRADIEDEPSISNTDMVVDHGVIGISSSKLVAGSTMTYETSLATASIRGRQAVVQAYDNRTVISMVQGEATVQAGPLDRGHLVKNRQQIIIVPGATGEPNLVTLQDIPPGQYEDDEAWLEQRVDTADSGRKLVYFETQASRGGRSGNGAGGGSSAGGSSDGGLSLFDGGGDSSSTTGTTSEIVAVPVVPSTSTVDPNVSPANLISH
jgi:uncharacterized membrane protein YgcG